VAAPWTCSATATNGSRNLTLHTPRSRPPNGSCQTIHHHVSRASPCPSTCPSWPKPVFWRTASECPQSPLCRHVCRVGRTVGKTIPWWCFRHGRTGHARRLSVHTHRPDHSPRLCQRQRDDLRCYCPLHARWQVPHEEVSTEQSRVSERSKWKNRQNLRGSAVFQKRKERRIAVTLQLPTMRRLQTAATWQADRVLAFCPDDAPR
jgi:hypothetical protein